MLVHITACAVLTDVESCELHCAGQSLSPTFHDVCVGSSENNLSFRGCTDYFVTANMYAL